MIMYFLPKIGLVKMFPTLALKFSVRLFVYLLIKLTDNYKYEQLIMYCYYSLFQKPNQYLNTVSFQSRYIYILA